MMHNYLLTGRTDTDRCISLANTAHNYYFANKIGNAKIFAITAKEFFDEIKKHICKRTQNDENNFDIALIKHFTKDGILNESKYSYFQVELEFNSKRLNYIIDNPSLINEKTVFILDYVARFIEVCLCYSCGEIKQEVEEKRKFNFKGIADVELPFFKLKDSNVQNKYLKAFYENAWRSQKNLNGFSFMKDKFNFYDKEVDYFYKSYGVIDYFASLIFARLANEQFLKFLSSKHSQFWNHLFDCLPRYLKNEVKQEIIEKCDNEDRNINIPIRIEALKKAGIINKLIANELKLVNQRGNNIVHQGLTGFYLTCYHNLQVLDYLNKTYR